MITTQHPPRPTVLVYPISLQSILEMIDEIRRHILILINQTNIK